MTKVETRAVNPAIAHNWRTGPLSRQNRTRLRAAGLRPTQQRLSLAALLFVAGDRHVTAERLYNEAKELNMPLSLATVYNTLKQFAVAGLVREIALYDSKIWYDTTTAPHCHYFNEDSGDLFDMPDTDWVKNLSFSAPDGKQVVGVDIIVRVKNSIQTENDAA